MSLNILRKVKNPAYLTLICLLVIFELFEKLKTSVEINTKDVKLVKTNISSLRSKRHLQSIWNEISFYQFYIFGINFNNDCASGYSFYNQAVCPKQHI